MKNEVGIIGNKFGIHRVLINYWFVLILWQNLLSFTNRSSLDIVIKITLLIYLSIGFLKRSTSINKRIFVLLLFVINLLISFLSSKDNFSIDNLIVYFYPIVLSFLVYQPGDGFVITIQDLIATFKFVIAVDLYMCLYAMVVDKQQFINAFKIKSAYGNELSSFLYSSHEYGLYLVVGIAFVLALIKIENTSQTKRIIYSFLGVIFLINLVLTYSRTSYLGLITMIISFVMMIKNYKVKIISIASVITVLSIISFNHSVNRFVFQIMLKDNNDAGRFSLIDLALNYFNNGTVLQKIWGHGVTQTRDYFILHTSHGSVHNAYLQVLLYFGIVGLIFLVGILFAQFKTVFNCLSINREVGSILVSFTALCIVIMFTNTTAIFFSSIDSFFLTFISIIIPKYVSNGIIKNSFM